MTHQPVLAPAVDHHARRVELVEPVGGARAHRPHELGRYRAHERVGEGRARGLEVSRRHEGVGLQEGDEVAGRARDRGVHRRGVGNAWLEPQQPGPRALRKLRRRIGRRVVQDDDLVGVLCDRGFEGRPEQRRLVRAENGEARGEAHRSSR